MNEVRKRHNERKIITEQHFCSKCGDRLASKYSSCVQCESELEQPKQKHMRRPVEWKSEAITLILSIFLPGTGHIYIGQLVKGIGLLVVGFVLFAFVFVEPLILIAAIPFTIWVCYDAYKLSKAYNNHIQQFGRAPRWQ